MSEQTKRVIIVFGILGLGPFCIPGISQTIVPSGSDSGRTVNRIDVRIDSEQSKKLADEYLEILEQLQQTIEDYSEYYSELDPEIRKTHPLSFDTFTEGLKSGRYAESYQTLLSDIENFVSHLKDIERKHQGGVGMTGSQCCRIIRNLRREMVVIVDLIEDYADNRKATSKWSRSITVYLRESMQELGKRLAELSLDEAKLRRHIEMSRIRLRKDSWFGDSMQSSGPHGIMRGVGKSISANADITVDNRNKRVAVTNPFGDIEISGWDEATVLARLKVRVQAESSIAEQQFLEQTGLTVKDRNNAYRVDVRLPKISDADTRVLTSSLQVFVPRVNPLSCTGSFGKISIVDVTQDVTVKGKHALIDLGDINGAVEATNSGGAINIGDIRGRVDITNEYAPVTIEGCDGEIVVQNSYAAINLNDNRGTVTVRNTGNTTIEDHKGDVSIQNRYGFAEVKSIDGSIIIENAYGPVVVSEIRGTVNAENNYAGITLEEIHGKLTARATRGRISGRNLGGPLKLASTRGTVSLLLNTPLQGTSIISSSFGTVTLNVEEKAGFFLTARTVNGSIRTLLPLKVVQNGQTFSTQHPFGETRDTLTIKGKNSSIVISGTR